MKKIFNKSYKTDNGITMVVLVVTVIILLILAGTTYSIVDTQSVMDRSEKAVKQYEFSDEQDAITLAFSRVFSNSELKNIKITPEALQEELNKSSRKTVVTWDAQDNTILNVEFEKTGNRHSINIDTGAIDE